MADRGARRGPPTAASRDVEPQELGELQGVAASLFRVCTVSAQPPGGARSWVFTVRGVAPSPLPNTSHTFRMCLPLGQKTHNDAHPCLTNPTYIVAGRHAGAHQQATSSSWCACPRHLSNFCFLLTFCVPGTGFCRRRDGVSAYRTVVCTLPPQAESSFAACMKVCKKLKIAI